QTVVDAVDPAFAAPAKPIGAFFSAEEAHLHRTRDRWVMVEDAGRGYRRVVASPRPQRIVEAPAIRALLDSGFVVIAAGGGGIPGGESAPGRGRGGEGVVAQEPSAAPR